MNILKGKAVILNSPPNTGKDTIAKSLCQVTGATHSEFKEHLYECTAKMFNVDLEWFKGAATDRETKEVISNELQIPYEGYCKLMRLLDREFEIQYVDMVNCRKPHITPREALIYTSEIVVKPNFGQDYFGKIAANNVNPLKGSVYSDGGFSEEVNVMVETLGPEKVFIVKFTRGDMTSFEGDSRNWLNTFPNVKELVTTNDGTVAQLRDEILFWIKEES